MSSNYTGLARPAVGQDAPSPAPTPGGAPVITIPADVDPNNVATMFAQQYPTMADWIAWLSTTARYCPPGQYSAVPGFSSVAHVGGGSGTITPGGRTYGGLYFVVKIIASGGLGVGTFQLSRDGGATYAVGTTTIPGGGTYTDGTTGVTVTFSGSFTAGDTYAFQQSFAPFTYFRDQAQHSRFLIDHNGYPLGRITVHREDWLDCPAGISETTDSLTNAALPLDLGSKWRFAGTSGTNQLVGGVVANLSGGKGWTISTGAAAPNGTKVYLRTRGRAWGFDGARTDMMLVFEGTVWVTNSAVSSIMVGLFDDFTTMSTSTNKIWLEKTVAGGANWIARVNATTVNTGVAPGAGGSGLGQRFRIEVYGVGTALGMAQAGGPKTVVLFFIDEELVASVVNVAAAGSYGIGFGVEQTSAGGIGSLFIDPCRWAFNHWFNFGGL